MIIVKEIEFCFFHLIEKSPNTHELAWIPLAGCLHTLVSLFSCDHGLITGLCMQPLKASIAHTFMSILFVSPLFNHCTL